ncbi:palmdelphin [Halichoeres trimaculatus]|uniref:palmdelphin n=1 Tax=Halichoeres trimaculatus TaxID=147232 RepID=UPI003D9F4B4C
MEESDLLKERLHAITEKHRIQEVIRRKKLELDQEKLKLQHLKKKSLREQWLLQGPATHNASGSPQQQQSPVSNHQETKALQLNIHRIEMDILSLEREESIVSTNESFILNRLKAVERSAEDIIKEAQDSFVVEPIQVAPVVPEVPERLSTAVSKHPEPNLPRKTLFAMEINVSNNLLTGESTVMSTATVPTEELHQHTGLKVYDDGRKCVYALGSQQVSHDQNRVSELSASDVEKLLRSATMHRQANPPNYRQHQARREELCFYHQHDDRDPVGGYDHMNMAGHHGDHVAGNNRMETALSWQRKPSAEHGYRQQEKHHRGQEERNNQSNLQGTHGNSSWYQVRNSHRAQAEQPLSCYAKGLTRSNSRMTAHGANGCPPPRSHDKEALSAYQPQLCYTPANQIPLSDYISVDEEELYCLGRPANHDRYQPSPLYGGPALSDRVPSPLYEDNVPYTILHAVDTTEPITAIFMGFQTAQDDTRKGHEFDGSLKAELVIIEDSEDERSEKNGHAHQSRATFHGTGSTNGNMRQTPAGPASPKQPKSSIFCILVLGVPTVPGDLKGIPFLSTTR